MWKYIDGFRWPYRINEKAEVQHLMNDGKTWKEVHPYAQRTTSHYGRLVVRVCYAPHKYGVKILVDLMAECFMGGRANHPGMVVVHKNSSIHDCALCNLRWGTMKEIGQKYGGNGRRPIEKVNSKGEVIAIYASMSEASRVNHISRKAIWRRCTNQAFFEYFADGTTYRYECKKEQNNGKKC